MENTPPPPDLHALKKPSPKRVKVAGSSLLINAFAYSSFVGIIRLSLRATSHLCVKCERPLIITYSSYSENTMHYHFYLKHVRREDRDAHVGKLALSQL